MKRALIMSAAALAALSLAACNKPAAEKTEAAAGSAVNATQDAAGAAVGATSAATMGSHDTPSFVSNAAQSDMYEVAAAKMAQTRSKNADIKAFAKMMVTDHTASTAKLKPLIAAAGQTPPAALDDRRQGFLDNLKAASDTDFDKVYVDQQVAGHEEALTLMKGYADNGDDAGLKAAAGEIAPKVQEHLDHIKAIKAAMK
jgi:putative membrane protein